VSAVVWLVPAAAASGYIHCTCFVLWLCKQRAEQLPAELRRLFVWVQLVLCFMSIQHAAPFTTLIAFFFLLKHLSFLDKVVLLNRLAYTGQVALAE
jgi:hypothetical protein